MNKFEKSCNFRRMPGVLCFVNLTPTFLTMNIIRYFTLGALGSVLFLNAAHARLEREITERFVVQPGGLASISTQGGDITITTGAADEVSIVARLVFHRADDDAEADEIMEQLDLTFAQTDDGISVSSQRLSSVSGWFGWGKSNPVSVHLHATVPTDYHIDARTSGGDIEVANLNGDIAARTSGGDIEVGHIEGSVDLHTSGGDIEVMHAVGRVKAHTSGGDVRIDGAEGPVTAGTSGGDVRIGRVVGILRATTSGGDIYARIEGPLAEDALLSTSGGNVTAVVDEAVAFDLDARTSGGNVKAQGITIRIDSGGVGKSKLVGAVNGGGPLLKLRTSGGDLRVKTS